MENPHVLVIPISVQGHIIPAMELTQCLGKHGIKVTVVNTDLTHELVSKALEKKDDTANSINLVSFPGDQYDIFKAMAGKVKKVVEQINASASDDKITCVVADNVLPWAMEMAAEMGIKRASFCPFAATLLTSASTIPKLIEDGVIGHDDEIIFH